MKRLLAAGIALALPGPAGAQNVVQSNLCASPVVPSVAVVAPLGGGVQGADLKALETIDLGPSWAARPPPVRKTLRKVFKALSGDAEAGWELPDLARLGADSSFSPGYDASPSDLKDGSEAEFHRRANLAPGMDPIDAGLGAEEAAPDFSGIESADADLAGGNGGRRRGGGEEDAPLPDPKYPARDVRFNGKTFPSSAFRPDRPIEPLLVAAIDAAKESIVVAAYEFKSRELLKALRRARDRGVTVQLAVDYNAAFPTRWPDSDYTPRRSLELQALINEGFDALVLRGMWKFGIMHNKFMVFDGKLAEFGSYNYTWTSERHHFENVKFTTDARRVQAFLRFFDYMRTLSVHFDRARAHPWPKELPPPPADDAPSVVLNGARFPAWFFSPGGGGEDWVVQAIESARESVDVSVFTLRSTRVAEALLAAKRRGVKVRVVLDRSQYESKTGGMRAYGDWLAFHRIRARVLAGPDPEDDERFQKNHNKFMVVDRALVETGSFNYTKNAALMSFENGDFTIDKVDAEAFSMFFDDLFRLGSALDAPKSEPRLPSDEELVRELLQEPEPPPPPVPWPVLPDAGRVVFNGRMFPAYAVRPQHPIQDLLVAAIDSSKERVRLSLYEFNLQPVLDSLRRAKARGVKVSVVLDFAHVFPAKGNDHTGGRRRRSRQIQALLDEGFDVRVLRGITAAGSNHNKFAVFDGKLVEFGSYNWAETAEHNHFEDVQFAAEDQRVAFYLKFWRYMYDAGVPFEEAAGYNWDAHRPGPPPKDTDWAIDLNGTRFPRTAVSPRGGIEAILALAIQAARETIDVAMFSFYSKGIAEALLSAKKRGVRVRLVLDENQAKLMKLDDWFAYHDFEVRMVAGPNDYGNVMFEKMHDKFMRIDDKWLETGSFNYTPNAENNNFENANFIDDSALIQAYGAFFRMLFDRGWKPRKPKRPPELRSMPADVFEDYFSS